MRERAGGESKLRGKDGGEARADGRRDAAALPPIPLAAMTAAIDVFDAPGTLHLEPGAMLVAVLG
jgi:hypothetical protein